MKSLIKTFLGSSRLEKALWLSAITLFAAGLLVAWLHELLGLLELDATGVALALVFTGLVVGAWAWGVDNVKKEEQ